MPRQAKVVRDMEIDEVSLVDAGAAQHSRIVIAKRANQEDNVPYTEPEEIFDAEENPVSRDDLEIGDIVYDSEGNAFEYAEDEPVRELASVAKSAFGTPVAKANDGLSSLREELAKAIGEGDQREVLSKVLDKLGEYEARTTNAEQIAKSERGLRLEREFIAKAAEYNLPVEPDQLGPVLMNMWEAEDSLGALPKGSCAVIHKALTTAGQILFTEAGYQGQSDNTDPFAQVEAYLEEQVSKSDTGISKAQAMTDFFAKNPEAYDEYVAGLGR